MANGKVYCVCHQIGEFNDPQILVFKSLHNAIDHFNHLKEVHLLDFIRSNGWNTSILEYSDDELESKYNITAKPFDVSWDSIMTYERIYLLEKNVI